MTAATGIPSDELEARRERLLAHVRGEGLTGLRPLRRRLHPLLHRLRVPRDRAPCGRDAETAAATSPSSCPSSRSSASARRPSFDRIESYPEYPGLEHPMLLLARVLVDLGIGSAGADENGYPGILGYQGPSLSEVTGRPVVPLGPVRREHDGAQERRPSRADPREREVVRARAPVAAGVLAPGRDRGRGGPAGGPRGDARDARGARPGLRRPAGVDGRRHGRVPRPDRARSAWAHAVAHNIPFEEGQVLVTESARRSGATTRSSSARSSSGRRPTRCGVSSTTPSPRSRSRSTRCGRA